MTTIIPLDQAIDWVNRWKSTPRDLFQINAFLVPEEDMIDILNEDKVKSIRGYFGIDETGGYHQLFVGVDKFGNDLINYAEADYVYDFTQPCPPMCSKTGPLV